MAMAKNAAPTTSQTELASFFNLHSNSPVISFVQSNRFSGGKFLSKNIFQKRNSWQI